MEGFENKSRKREWGSLEESPNVLWAYHTTLWESTGEILFKLSFGMETTIPIEILSETSRMKVK